MKQGVLIDTNAYAAFKRGDQDAVLIVRHVPIIGISSIVLGELLGGFAVGTREKKNVRDLKAFLGSQKVRLFSADDTTASFYAKIYRNLRRKGRPIPTNDMWIAAMALQHNLTIFTFDNHFRYVEDIFSGKSLSDFMSGT